MGQTSNMNEFPGDATLPELSFGPENIYETNPDLWKNRCYLPHFDAGEIVQFISMRLYDAVPRHLIDFWKEQLQWPEGAVDPETVIKLTRLIDKYADAGYGHCFFRQPEISQLVESSLLFNDNRAYRLLGWTVMPNHIHFMIILLQNSSLPKTIRALKSYIAHQANIMLNRSGEFWQREYYDRYIRSWSHFIYARNYILSNPQKIGYTKKYTQVIALD